MTGATPGATAPLDPRVNAARELLQRRAVCRADPVEFARELGLKPAAHHRLILDNIRALIADDTADVLVILAPPGSAKSTYAVKLAAAWALLRDPAAELLLCANVAELAFKFGREIRQTVADEPWQRMAGTSSSLAEDSTAAGRWGTPEGGGLFAVGVGGTVLGRRADLALLDDLVATFEVAANPAQLAKISDWLVSDLFSRLKPRGKVVMVQQRMAWNDPPGFVQRHFAGTSTRVRTITLPMLAGPEDDPLGRAEGAMLWPEWFTARTVESAMLDDVRWRTMWQQQPLQDTGQFFGADAIDTLMLQPELSRCTVSLCVDLATGQPGGDFTCIAAVAQFTYGGIAHLYILDLYRERCSVETAALKVGELARRWDASRFLIDDDSFWKASRSIFAGTLQASGRYVHPEALTIGGKDKATRAAPLRALTLSRRVHAPADARWLPTLRRELEMFPLATGNGVDDQVDALALIARKLGAAAAAPDALPGVELGFMGQAGTVRLPGDFGGALGVDLTRGPLLDPLAPTAAERGLVTASMVSKLPGESDDAYLHRKSHEETERVRRRSGIYGDGQGRMHVSAAVFEVLPSTRNDRLGD